MKKTKVKPAGKRVQATPLSNSAHDPVDIAALRQQITDMVVNEAVGMVTATIEQVNEGHFQAMKYLFEMVGLYPAPVQQEGAQDSLARTLLSRLGLLEEETKTLAPRPVAAATSTVE